MVVVVVVGGRVVVVVVVGGIVVVVELAVVVAGNVVCSPEVLPELHRLGSKQQVRFRWNSMTWLGRWQDG